MQNNLVRGPPKKVRTTNNRFSQCLIIQQDTKVLCSRSDGQPPVICDTGTGFFTTSPEICTGRMPLRAYIEGRPRISRHFSGDMLPDDATGSVYHGSPAHISCPPSASARADAVSACIDERGSETDILVENCCLMRRDAARSTSLRTDSSIYALYGIICAQRRQSDNASAHDPISRDQRSSVPDSSLPNDSVTLFRRTFLVTIDEAARRSEGSGAPRQAHIERCRGIPYYVVKITNNIDFSSIRNNVLSDCYYRTES